MKPYVRRAILLSLLLAPSLAGTAKSADDEIASISQREEFHESTFSTTKTARVITVPSTITQSAAGWYGAAVTFMDQVSATEGSTGLACDPTSGSIFSLGTTTVTCSASLNGVMGTNSFNVVVEDSAPVIAQHANIIIANNLYGWYEQPTIQVTYAIYATDDVDGDVSGSVTCDPPSGSYMTSGSYQTVTCTASDDSTGHTASPMSFTIVADNSWVDNLGVPADKALTATSGDGAKLTLTLSEFTKPEYAEKINCTSSHLASGSIYTFGTEYTFPVGLTTVTCKSLRYDEFGEWESSKDSFDVLVQDKTAPYMTKTSPTENLISYTIKQASKEASDVVDGDLSDEVICSHTSPYTFTADGVSHKVTCDVRDEAGNSATQLAFYVQITQDEPPVIDQLDDIHISTKTDSKMVTWQVTADDEISGDLSSSVVCEPVSGSVFKANTTGITTPVTCSVTDEIGNVASMTFSVKATTDTTVPVITQVDDIYTTTQNNSKVVEWEVSANDNISGDLSSSVVCAPMSGSVFKANTTGINTPVICSVTDGAGNVASMSFHVITTTDTTPPIITKTSPTTDMNYVTKEVSWTVQATDNNDGDLTSHLNCSHTSPYTFPADGQSHTVTCDVEDGAGNQASQLAFSVMVTQDKSPPEIISHLNISRTIHTDSYNVSFVVKATDNIDDDVVVTCAPESDSVFSTGSTPVKCNVMDTAGNDADEMVFYVILTKQVSEVAGYAFFDFELSVQVPETVTAETLNVNQTKATFRKAISQPLQIDESLITVNDIYFGTSKDDKVPLLRRRLTTNKLFADSTIAVEVHQDDVAAGGGDLSSGAADVVSGMVSSLRDSVESGEMTDHIQEAASLLGNTDTAGALVDSTDTTLPSESDFSYGTSPNSNMAVMYQPSSGDDKGYNIMSIGICAAVGVLVLGAVVAAFIMGKKKQVNPKVAQPASTNKG